MHAALQPEVPQGLSGSLATQAGTSSLTASANWERERHRPHTNFAITYTICGYIWLQTGYIINLHIASENGQTKSYIQVTYRLHTATYSISHILKLHTAKIIYIYYIQLHTATYK
jgi:hypothetical protein